MYAWRKLNLKQREELLTFRRLNDRPWHSPLHVESQNGRYLLTAACYEHRHIIGLNPKRVADFAEELVRFWKPMVKTSMRGACCPIITMLWF